jgi:hypothetical protein
MFRLGCQANKLTLKNKKTEFMVIGSNKRLGQIVQEPSICVRGTEIKKVNATKSLGLMIDDTLCWSLNKEKVSREISENKIAVCEKTQCLRSGNFSDLNSACSIVLVPVKIFQFQDMHYENRFLGTFQGHSKRPRRTKAFREGNKLLIWGRLYKKVIKVNYN